MIQKTYFPILIVGFLLLAACKTQPHAEQVKSQVMVLASMHGYHTKNPNYTYQDLFGTVENFKPDVVAVEIRPEDVERDTAYLKSFYPYEMHELLRRFPNAKHYGFDWWGADLEGKLLSRQLLADSTTAFAKIKTLEKAIYQDTLMMQKMLQTKKLQQAQFEILKEATAAQLNDGRYDSVTALYYESFYKTLSGTKYEPRATFNQLRDKHIGDNMLRIIQENPGKKIVFVTGADHRGFAIKRIQQEMGEQVAFVAIP